MIKQLSKNEVIVETAINLGLEKYKELGLSEILLSSLIRRVAGYNCPCSIHSIKSAVKNALIFLTSEADNLSELIDETIEKLIIYGDLIELENFSPNDQQHNPGLIYASPPGFVARSSGSVFVVGISPDYDNFLPEHLSARMERKGVARVIVSQVGEDLSAALEDYGIHKITERNWLKSPKYIEPDKLIDDYDDKLSYSPCVSVPEGMIYLNSASPVNYYRGRWVSNLKNITTNCIARRPKQYGAPMWCYVRLQDGNISHMVDLPARRSRWRACDVAWQLQLAIDFLRGNQQEFSVTFDGDEAVMEFYSPLPLWAQRRLMIIGEQISRQRGLFAFKISKRFLEEESDYMKRVLWLKEV